MTQYKHIIHALVTVGLLITLVVQGMSLSAVKTEALTYQKAIAEIANVLGQSGLVRKDASGAIKVEQIVSVSDVQALQSQAMPPM